MSHVKADADARSTWYPILLALTISPELPNTLHSTWLRDRALPVVFKLLPQVDLANPTEFSKIVQSITYGFRSAPETDARRLAQLFVSSGAWKVRRDILSNDKIIHRWPRLYLQRSRLM